tara:strand:- start:574 stop:900 length:327 start_codon:yes stop_codon:yes gene_type:complete
MKKAIIIISITIVVFAIIFRTFCGIFVIQPIGAIPEGTTIIYWRTGLNIPFIASADGILEETGAGVSLLGRVMVIAKLAEPINEKEIIRFGYSETLYLYSTGGKSYDR